MATHSSVLAWEIRWTEEPGGLQSMEPWSGTQLSTLTQTTTILDSQSPLTLPLPFSSPSQAGRCRAAQLASIRKMSRQVSRGSAGEYQADERAGIAQLSWRVSGR